jgi:hypothetical protein
VRELQKAFYILLPQSSLMPVYPRLSTLTFSSCPYSTFVDGLFSLLRDHANPSVFHPLQHCRRCGRVYCSNCSAHRTLLDPHDVVQDPSLPEERLTAPSMQRVCQSCLDEVSSIDIPRQLRSSGGLESVVVSQASLAIPAHMRGSDASSQISDLAE